MSVTVENGRAVRLQGSKDHPLTGGFLCARTVRYLDRVYSPDRITRPLLRRRGRLEPVSWEEALDRAAAELRAAREQHGPHAVLHYRSAGSMGLAKRLADRFWNLFGGVTELTGDFCLGAGKAALQRHFGDFRPHGWSDLAHSRTIILWGRDPFTSGPHILPFLRGAVRAGARVVSVNPTGLGHPRIVHEEIRVRPGGDLALALGVASAILDQGLHDESWIARHAAGFEAFREILQGLDGGWVERRSGVGRTRMAALARRLARGAPAAILLGTGVIRHRAGLDAAAAIAMLPALLGSIGRPGGGISFSVRTTRGLDLSVCAPRPDAANREIPSSQMPRLLPALDPPIRVGWVECANPANAFGDSPGAARALRSIPFLVAAEFHRTATTDLADLVLPVPSFLEADDIVPSWGQFYLAVQRASIDAVGESRSDLQIYQALAERLGFGDQMSGTAREWCDRMIASSAEGARLRRELDERGFARNRVHEEVPWADGRFATPSGKFEFLREVHDLDAAEDGTTDYPVTLLSPKSAEHHLSQVLPSRRRKRYEVRLSPTLLERQGIREGQPVRLRSERGAIEAIARADRRLAADVAVLPMSGWAVDGNDVNLLTAPDVARDGVTFAYYDCRIRVEPVERGDALL